jgi:WD40 repeat protein
VYFGRDPQIADLIRRLHALDASAADRFICVTGASGSGKSSLVHAGILPRLRARRWTVLPVVTPAGEPLKRLAATLAAGSPADISTVAQRLRDPGYTAAVPGRTRLGRVLLVLDQLEELVTLSGPADRDLFLGAVARILVRDRRLWVLATLRVEFLPGLLESEHAGLFSGPVTLGAMRSAELVAAIERPAALANLALEPGLVADIVEDTATADALPLLAYLLQELYQAAGAGGVATREAYRALGGVAGALARQADSVFAALVTVYDADTVLRTLLRLVGMDGTEATRIRVSLDAFSLTERSIVAAFTNARLLVTDAADGAPVAQVAHEALFRQWPPLRQHVAARAEQLRSRSELERWAAEWAQSGRSTDYLLTGERLALALQWLEALTEAGQASEDVRLFVTLSRSRDRAFLERVSTAIGAYVLSNVEQDPELGILLAAAALAECPPTAAARRALMAAMAQCHAERTLVGHAATVRATAWSADGHRIITASRDGTARIWDARTATTEHVLRGHDGMVDGAAWAPNGRHVATASRDRTVRVWDTRSGSCVATLTAFGDFARAVAWSPDGGRLAATSRDRIVRVFTAGTWELAAALVGHGDDVWGVAWSPDGERLASASHDRTAIIWDADTGSMALRLDDHGSFVEGVAWAPDGVSLATTSGNSRLQIWDASDGQLRRTMMPGRDPVWAASWSSDGSRIACACGDGTARIWNAVSGEELTELRGHGDVVWSIAWSADDERLVTGSEDGTARIWKSTARGAEAVLIAGHLAEVTAVVVRPGGERLASGSRDGTIRLWDAETAGPVAVATGHRGGVTQVSWSPDGTAIASCGEDRTVRLQDQAGASSRVLMTAAAEFESLAWAPDGSRLAAGGRDNSIHVVATGDGTELARLSGHSDWVGALAWSPDERLLATCSGDWTIRVWDTGTRETVHRLAGHEQRVRAIAWSPDGTSLASASDDRTVRTWDPVTGTERGVIGVHADRAGGVDWLPDGQRVASSSADRTIRIWRADVDLSALVLDAGSRVSRRLTAQERSAHFLPGQP